MSAPELRRPLGSRLFGGGLIALAIAGALWFSASALSVAFTRAVEPGQPAPDFEATSLGGERIQLAELRGKVVLLDFWTTTCVGCVGGTPKHNRMAERFGPDGLVVLGINQDPGDVEAVQAYVRDRPVEYPTVVDDGDIAEAFGVTAFPTAILIDAEGYVRARHVGAVTEDRVVREVGFLLQASRPTSASDAGPRRPRLGGSGRPSTAASAEPFARSRKPA